MDKYQHYFLELNKRDLELLKKSCRVNYQISKENHSISSMLRLRSMENRLNALERGIIEGK